MYTSDTNFVHNLARKRNDIFSNHEMLLIPLEKNNEGLADRLQFYHINHYSINCSLASYEVNRI